MVDMMHETTLVRPIARAGKPSEVQNALVSFENVRGFKMSMNYLIFITLSSAEWSVISPPSYRGSPNLLLVP